jgi:hypothetical protein
MEIIPHVPRSWCIDILNIQNSINCSHTVRKINKVSGSEFLTNLSYESWDNIFVDNDVDTLLNTFINTYSRTFYCSFPLKKLQSKHSNKDWITTGVKISCLHKREFYLNNRNITIPKLRSHYKSYCRILSNVTKASENFTTVSRL